MLRAKRGVEETEPSRLVLLSGISDHHPCLPQLPAGKGSATSCEGLVGCFSGSKEPRDLQRDEMCFLRPDELHRLNCSRIYFSPHFLSDDSLSLESQDSEQSLPPSFYV